MKYFLAVLVLMACYAGATSAGEKRWIKMNRKGPVCFGARANSFGYFNYVGPDRNASAFMLKHVSGWVSCSGKGARKASRSNWGCAPAYDALSTAFTDCKNKIIAPLESPYASWHHKAWYRINGYTSSSEMLVLPTARKNSIYGPLRNSVKKRKDY